MDTLSALYDVVISRKTNPEANSYTCYLFEAGLDKILKKIGEESAETIIAAKNGDNKELANEICDLIFHLLVLMGERELPLSDVTEELARRSAKIGNLKQMRQTDRNT